MNQTANLRILSLTLGLSSILCGVSTTTQAQELLTHHVRTEITHGKIAYLRPMLANKILRLDLVLALHDQEDLDNFIEDLYNPASPSYKKYLTVTEFTKRFGPNEEDYNAVINFANAKGFKIIGGSRDGMDIQIEGSVAAIEKAFNITLQVYEDYKANRKFYAPNREPTVNLPFPLWHISGLDNYSIPHPRYKRKKTGLAELRATTGSGPQSSFLGSDMRAAYYQIKGKAPLTGAGQTLGLLEFYGTNLNDLNNYYRNTHQTNSVPITLLSTDGTSTQCNAPDCDDSEQTLDMTQALGMAPGLKNLVMFIGSIDTAIFSSMVSHQPLATTIGCSWGWLPADTSTLNPYWKRMQAQGQTFFAASGDNSTWSAYNEAWPADSQYVVSVGGTDLITTGAGGTWKSETAWEDSGGGISPDNIAIPSWQKLLGVINLKNRGSKVLRNGPDVAANANFSFYVCANQASCTANEFGGTSFAAPMWAAYIALANQQAAAHHKPNVGFLNATLYSIGVSSVYELIFHDITQGTSGSYSATVGYDLVTGWGSMYGPALINYLTL